MKRYFISSSVLAAIVMLVISAAAVPAQAQFGGPATTSGQTISKSCSACGRAVSVSSQAGQRCPHCGAYWAQENTKTITPPAQALDPEPAPTPKECSSCKREVPASSKIGQRCPYCNTLWSYDETLTKKTPAPVATPRPVPAPPDPVGTETVTETIPYEPYPDPYRTSLSGIDVMIDGKMLGFTGYPPVMQAGSVLVPMRDVFNALNASVEFDAPTRTIFAIKDGTIVSLKLGRDYATINGRRYYLPVAPRVRQDTTLVPLRFVAEALGAVVWWDASNRTVMVRSRETASTNAITDRRQMGPLGARRR